MGEYEPDDSRIITQNPAQTPIEPRRPVTIDSPAPGKDGSPSGRKEDRVEPDPREAERWQIPDAKSQAPDAETPPDQSS